MCQLVPRYNYSSEIVAWCLYEANVIWQRVQRPEGIADKSAPSLQL